MRNATELGGDGGVMQVSVNGKPHEIKSGISVAGLIEMLKLRPKFVAVEINRELVPRSTFEQTTIREGDAIEVVTLVGGG